MEQTGRSTPGLQYCLSSEPLSKKEYSLYFILSFFKTLLERLSKINEDDSKISNLLKQLSK